MAHPGKPTEPVRSSKDDDEGAVVHLLSATTSADLNEEMTQLLIDCLRDVAAELPGFLDGRVFQADDQTSVVVMTHWESRHLWARAQWNDTIGQLIARVHQQSSKIEMLMGYQRAVVTRGSHG